jgi:hypothetical protein
VAFGDSSALSGAGAHGLARIAVPVHRTTRRCRRISRLFDALCNYLSLAAASPARHRKRWPSSPEVGGAWLLGVALAIIVHIAILAARLGAMSPAQARRLYRRMDATACGRQARCKEPGAPTVRLLSALAGPLPSPLRGSYRMLLRGISHWDPPWSTSG